MTALLCIALALLSLQSADRPDAGITDTVNAQAPGYSDGEIAVLVQSAIVSDRRGLSGSADQLGRSVNMRPDSDVARDVDALLRKRLDPVPPGLSVTCTRGTVLLRGQVSDEATIKSVTADVGKVPGVRAVLNRMGPAEQSQPDAPPIVDPDGPRSRTAPFIFLTSDGLAAKNVVLEVKDGEILVQGLASSATARDYVTASAGRVPGARMVRNAMTLRPISPRDDERLGRLVTKKLQWEQKLQDVSASFSISVRNGILQLSGTVDTEQQAELARYLATDTVGIIVVDDHVKVAAPRR